MCCSKAVSEATENLSGESKKTLVERNQTVTEELFCSLILQVLYCTISLVDRWRPKSVWWRVSCEHYKSKTKICLICPFQ